LIEILTSASVQYRFCSLLLTAFSDVFEASPRLVVEAGEPFCFWLVVYELGYESCTAFY
jgi:hypothetical protein